MKTFLEIFELRPALSDILPVALGQNGDRLLRIERNIVDVAVEDIAQDDAVFAPGHLAGKAIDAHIVALPEPQLRLDGDHLSPITDLQDPAVIELNQQRDGHLAAGPLQLVQANERLVKIFHGLEHIFLEKDFVQDEVAQGSGRRRHTVPDAGQQTHAHAHVGDLFAEKAQAGIEEVAVKAVLLALVTALDTVAEAVDDVKQERIADRRGQPARDAFGRRRLDVEQAVGIDLAEGFCVGTVGELRL